MNVPAPVPVPGRSRVRPAYAALALCLVAGLSHAAEKPRPSPGPPALPPAPPRVSVSAAALEVVSAGFGEKGKELQPFGHAPGARIALLVRAGAPFAIVSLDAQRSVIDEVRDGAGQLLPGARLQPAVPVAADGQAALVEVRAPGVPDPRAGALSVLGRLSLTLAGGATTLRSGSVKLRTNARFTLGGERVDVTGVEAGPPRTVTVQGPASVLGALKALRLVAGKAVVPVARWTSGREGDRVSVTFPVAATTARAAMEVEIWRDLRTLAVPFAVQSGLGLGDPHAAAAEPARRPAPGPLALALLAAGVKVVAAGVGEAGAALRPFGDDEGTSAVLALTAPLPLTLTAVEASAVEVQDASGAAVGEGQVVSLRRSADGAVALLEVRTPSRPPEGSTGLRLRGALEVGVADGVETVRVPSVILQAGDTFRLAGRVIAIRQVQTTPASLQFTLEGAAAALDPVRAVRFRPRGLPALPAEERGRSSAGGVTSVAFRVAGQEPAGDFEIESWRAPRSLRLDFDAAAGLGLPPPAELSSPHP